MTASIVTALVGLPYGFTQIPQTGIGTFGMALQITVTLPLTATPNPISGVGTIGLKPGAVDNSYLSTAPGLTLKGNLSGNPAALQDLTVAQVITMLGGPFLTLAGGGIVTGAVSLTSPVKLLSLPTSATGLVAGQLWRNGNVVNIV